MYRTKLTAYEQSEILDYSEVWHLGLEAKKIDAIQGTSQNSGYDDDSGSYVRVSAGHRPSLVPRPGHKP